MKKFTLSILSLATISIYATKAVAQEGMPAMCRASEEINKYYALNPEAKAEQEANESFTQQHVQMLAAAQNKSTAVDTYRVAVVFHVYGTNQGGNTVSDTLIQSAIKRLNDDFHGLNADYNQVHTSFIPVRSKKNIKFYLAKKDPNGNPTTGIVYYPTLNGYGNGTGYDSQIAADAWDNYKYINVYVQHDLYNDGTTTNSGVAWYPNTGMSNAGTARIVYNGAYLASNTSIEFSSVLTHEFGHFFNLIHTFEGGCTTPNDQVSDTPPCTTAQGCHTNTTAMFPMNCNNQLVNSDNYMDYNICYKMFTTGQASRMDAALYLPSRVTLWQDSTLSATGIYTPASVKNTSKNTFTVYPNPSKGNITVETGMETHVFAVKVMDITGRTVICQSTQSNGKINIDLTGNTNGIYFIQVRNEDSAETIKVELH